MRLVARVDLRERFGPEIHAIRREALVETRRLVRRRPVHSSS